MRKFTGTWIVVAVFAALLAFLLIGKPKSRDEVKEDSLRLVSADRDALERVEIENANGTFVLERDEPEGGDATWTVTQTAPAQPSATPLPVEESVLNQVKNTLSELLASDPVWTKAGDEERKKSGLADPAAVVRWKAGTEEGTLEIGSEVPRQETFYVAASGKPGIYTASKWSLDAFTRGLDGYRRKKILAFDRDAIRTVLVEVPGREPMMLQRTDALAPWSASTPFEGRADRGRVNGLLTRLSNLRAETFVDDPPKDSGLDGLRGTISLTDDGGSTWSVLVGAEVKAKDGGEPLFHVRAGERGAVALAKGPLPEDLVAPFSEWRDKQLFDFFVDDVTRVELSLEKGPLVVERNPDRMFETAGEASVTVNPEATGLLRALRDAEIESFGSEAPAGSAKSKELGLESPVVRATLKLGERTLELVVGATKPGTAMRWVRTNEQDTAVLVSADPIVTAAAELAAAPGKAAASATEAAASPASSPSPG